MGNDIVLLAYYYWLASYFLYSISHFFYTLFLILFLSFLILSSSLIHPNMGKRLHTCTIAPLLCQLYAYSKSTSHVTTAEPLLYTLCPLSILFRFNYSFRTHFHYFKTLIKFGTCFIDLSSADILFFTIFPSFHRILYQSDESFSIYIQVMAINLPPTAILPLIISLPDNTPGGAIVARLSSLDPNNNQQVHYKEYIYIYIYSL